MMPFLGQSWVSFGLPESEEVLLTSLTPIKGSLTLQLFVIMLICWNLPYLVFWNTFQEVLEQRKQQIEDLQKQREDNKKLLENEERLSELLRLEEQDVEKDKKRAMEKRQKEYRADLTKQIEDNKQLLVGTYEYCQGQP